MKRSIKTNFCLLILIGILNTSCAQEPQSAAICCEIRTLEDQIDKIEKLRGDLEMEIKPQANFESIWRQLPSGFKKPSKDAEFKKVCDSPLPGKPKSPLDLSLLRNNLARLRKLSMDDYFALAKQCEKDMERYEGGVDASREEVGVSLEIDSAEEPELVENYDPKDFTKQEIPFEKELPFIVMDDVEYGRKSDLKKYICVIYDPKSTEYGVDFLYGAKIDGSWGRIKSFKNAETYLNNSKRSPVMLMNAGIFNPDFKPTGLWYRNGHRSFDFNNKTGLPGNFYMDPGGVFAIKKGGVATILTREEQYKNIKDTVNYTYATQSGPMLVIDGKPHPDFKSHSPNLHIRNGVGILPDGKIVFIISKDEVNFFEFALLFKDGFKCKDALYLDGTISRIYAPAIQRKDPGGNFAGIIAIYKKSSK